MVLEHDRPGPARVAPEAGDGVVDGDRDVLVDLDAVLPDADARRLDLPAALELGGVEVDVVGLPDGGGLAGVDAWGGHLVDSPAVVVPALEAVAVEDLDLVAALEIDAAVAAPLALGLGHVGDAELDVEPEVAVERPPGLDVAPLDLHRAALDELPRRGRAVPGLDPLVQVLAVEQDDGAGRGRRRRDVDLVLGPGEFQVADVAVRPLAPRRRGGHQETDEKGDPSDWRRRHDLSLTRSRDLDMAGMGVVRHTSSLVPEGPSRHGGTGDQDRHALRTRGWSIPRFCSGNCADATLRATSAGDAPASGFHASRRSARLHEDRSTRARISTPLGCFGPDPRADNTPGSEVCRVWWPLEDLGRYHAGIPVLGSSSDGLRSADSTIHLLINGMGMGRRRDFGGGVGGT